MSIRLLPQQPVTQKGDLPSLDLVEIIQRLAQQVGSGGSVAWADITGIPATFTPSAHVHAATDITSGILPAARFNDTTHGARSGGNLHADAISGGASGFMSGTDKAKLDGLAAVTAGTATLSFGAAPGTNIVTTTVATAVPTGARVNVWFQADSTADHNAYEHAIVFPGRVSLVGGNIVNGVSFDITASTELRLTGSVACRWEWSS